MPKRAPTGDRRIRKPRGRYHHGDLGAALVRAAIELVAAKGPEAFTLREASRLAGVNHRAAYRHFADKESFLAEVSAEGWRTLRAAIHRDVSRARDARAALVAAARAYVRFAMVNSAHYRVMTGPRLAVGGRFAELEELASSTVREIGRLTAAARERRGPEAREHGLVVFSLLLGYCDLALTGRVAAGSARRACGEIEGLVRRVLDG